MAEGRLFQFCRGFLRPSECLLRIGLRRVIERSLALVMGGSSAVGRRNLTARFLGW